MKALFIIVLALLACLPLLIGKGIHAHEKEAARAKTVCSKKINKINELRSAGLEIGKQQVAFFWDEQAAYDHETDLIEEIGLENLTNVLPGGQGAWSERQRERASRREKPLEPLHQWLSRPSVDHLWGRLAEWFRIGGHEGAKIKATASDPAYKWHAAITDATYNVFLPVLWSRIKDDEEALAVCKRKIEPHGVVFA